MPTRKQFDSCISPCTNAPHMRRLLNQSYDVGALRDPAASSAHSIRLLAVLKCVMSTLISDIGVYLLEVSRQGVLVTASESAPQSVALRVRFAMIMPGIERGALVRSNESYRQLGNNPLASHAVVPSSQGRGACHGPFAFAENLYLPGKVSHEPRHHRDVGCGVYRLPRPDLPCCP
jgi:hypothetical protein